MSLPKYLNLDALQRGMCGPTSDWVMVIPEVKAALQEIEDLKRALETAADCGACDFHAELARRALSGEVKK